MHALVCVLMWESTYVMQVLVANDDGGVVAKGGALAEGGGPLLQVSLR